jgi:hypothetical protein
MTLDKPARYSSYRVNSVPADVLLKLAIATTPNDINTLCPVLFGISRIPIILVLINGIQGAAAAT